ncbi:MFS transporter [Kitasatospora sp. RB6PN24]|uniref:MFS transporter n=1 Tax=Kitasatospora humi TaxID=2893891 RepID=UPI001E411A52|nr:MFS transporter [Kitasatospora humi]MCC9309994.1 MFS transporter [Kitasatospora humi]
MTSRETGVWRRMRLWGAAHAVDDLYQGLVPAMVPYFVLERGWDYVAAAGLALAATLGSSLPQPLIGLAVDRWRLPWLAAAGVALAGTGVGLSGLVGGYPLVWALLLLSGIGVSMFHPAAGKAARQAAGESATAMSVFAAGGSVGFFLAPVLATPALTAWGVKSTALFLAPALLTAVLLHRAGGRGAVATGAASRAGGTDHWGPFLVLTGVAVVRSMVFFGISTFIELYWLRQLHASQTLAGAALACFLAGGVTGTLGGGRLADRIGMVRTAQLGTVLIVPALLALLLVPGRYLPLLFAVLTGVVLNLPFAVTVKLGQDYLPARPGTAAGVTLGLAVSVGGLVAPPLGLVAQAHGPRGALAVVCVLPLAAVLLGAFLVEPERLRRSGRRSSAGSAAPGAGAPASTAGSARPAAPPRS